MCAGERVEFARVTSAGSLGEIVMKKHFNGKRMQSTNSSKNDRGRERKKSNRNATFEKISVCISDSITSSNTLTVVM